MGILHLVVAKNEIGGTDPYTYVSILISLVALVVSFITATKWVKDLFRVGAGVALIEFLLLVVSMPLWERVVIGVVLFAVGGVWVVRANRKVSPEHAEQIHAVLDRVGTALKDGSPSNLGNPDADIITRHFPKLAKQVKAWDAAVNDVATAKESLRTSVESGLRELHADKQPYQFDSIRDGLCAITEARTADPAASTQPFPPMTGNENKKPIFTFHWSDAARFVFLVFNEATGATGDVLRLEGSNYPGVAAQGYDERYGRPIYDFLSKMQTWGSTRNLFYKRKVLSDFARDALERAVKKQRDKTYYRRARRCPGCKN